MPGLRREEVAVLAGVSVPYYTRLERGDMNGVSENVLDTLARALRLDDAERAHLFDLARAAQPTVVQPRRRQPKQRVRPEVQWTLDAISNAAAFVGNQRLDFLAANELGRALFSEMYAAPARPVNNARFVFLDTKAEAFFADWDIVVGGVRRDLALGLRVVIRTTATSLTSSASSRHRAKRSAPAGPRTTCASITRESSGSTISWSASSA